MLSGQTAFDSKLLRDEQIREAVTQHRGNPPVERPELEHAGVVKVVEQALAATGRYNNVIELAKALIAIYGRPPAEKRPYPRRMYVLLISLAVLLVATLGVAAFILLQILLR